MRTCQQFITATARCGKPAVITALECLTQDLCAECAMHITMRRATNKPRSSAYDRPESFK